MTGQYNLFSDLNVYAVYKVEFIRLRHSTAGGAYLLYQAGTSSSSFITSSSYGGTRNRQVHSGNNNTGTDDTNGVTQAYIGYHSDDWKGDANHYFDGHCYIYGQAGDNANQYPRIQFSVNSTTKSNSRQCFIDGGNYVNTSSTCTSAKFYLSTGTFTAGKMKLYGIS